jgi:propionyl-CoA synthetase
MGRYQQEFRRSLADPDQFWRDASELTRSGKILRKTMRGIADGNDEPVPSTIEDLAALDALRPLLHGD